MKTLYKLIILSVILIGFSFAGSGASVHTPVGPNAITMNKTHSGSGEYNDDNSSAIQDLKKKRSHARRRKIKPPKESK